MLTWVLTIWHDFWWVHYYKIYMKIYHLEDCKELEKRMNYHYRMWCAYTDYHRVKGAK